MSCGCSFQKKKPVKETFQISPCLEQTTIDFDNCFNEKNKKCFEKGIKDYRTCLESGMNFMFSETAYRQSIKCPCPYEYPSYHCPKIPFI